jgi:purine nucleosidase
MRRIILDCDPGLDDALAILLAHGDPDIDLVAITTVGGNVSLENTTRNALQLAEYLGISEVPIAAGAAEPLVRVAEDASHVHGAEGMGTVRLPAPLLAVSPIGAVDLIIEIALQKEPAIAEWAASFVIMGGSFTRGNATPAAEFNIYADPEAAAVVFAAGWQVVMIGLDLTLQAIATTSIVDRMRELGRLGDELLVPLSTFWNDPNDPSFRGQAVHDVVAVAYVVHPEWFESRAARVEVETDGRFTSGMTVVDFSSSEPNALVPVRLDTESFWDYALATYARIQH